MKNILIFLLACAVAHAKLDTNCNSQSKTCSNQQISSGEYHQIDINYDQFDKLNRKDKEDNAEDKPESNNQTNIKTETKYKNITYRNLFEKKGDEEEVYKKSFEKDSNYTDYYDFTLLDEEVSAIYQDRILHYPFEKFTNNNQGNFLHFLKVAYEKRLPVFLTTDVFTEGLIKTVNRIKKTFFEEVLIFYIKKFAETMSSFISTNKDKPLYKSVRFTLDSIQVYYSLLSYLISNKIEEFLPKKDVEAEFNRWKKTVEAYSISEVFFMGKKKIVNYSLLQPKGQWKSTQRLINIWQSTAFLTVHKFHIENDIKAIWIMGKLVDDAGMGDHFNKLSDMLTYFKGQNSILLNVVQIARLGSKQGLSDYSLTQEEYLVLSEIASKERQVLSLTVLDQMLLWSKEQVEEMKELREKHSHFLNEDYTVVDWSINKVKSYKDKSLRTIVSYMEINQIISGNKINNPLIKNRMKGVKRTINDKIMPLRDFVSYSENLEASQTVISRSMELEVSGWRDNLQNHFHLLNQNANKPYINKDPLYKSKLIKEKNFNFGPTFFSLLNTEYKTITRYMGYNTVDGGIPEVWLEANQEYYNEVDKFLIKFESVLNDFISSTEQAMKVNFRYVRSRIQRALEDLNTANYLIKRSIELQESSRMTTEMKEELKKLLFVEEISETWDGWMARLYDVDNQIGLFNFEGYSSFINQSSANENEGFLGANHFLYNKFNEIGVCIVKDNQTKTEKMLLFSSTSWGEEYLKLDDFSLNSIKESITKRLIR